MRSTLRTQTPQKQIDARIGKAAAYSRRHDTRDPVICSEDGAAAVPLACVPACLLGRDCTKGLFRLVRTMPSVSGTIAGRPGNDSKRNLICDAKFDAPPAEGKGKRPHGRVVLSYLRYGKVDGVS